MANGSASAVQNLTPQQLKLQRIHIYKTSVIGGVPSVFLTINNVVLIPASESNRSKNFKTFVAMYLYKGIEGSNDPFSSNFGGPLRLKPGSMGYKGLERYANTDYGSAVIKEMISHPNKYKGFNIQQARGLHAKAGGPVIYLPVKFPNSQRFKISGQKIYDLAIIHHEFAHTMLVRGKTSGAITLKDELWAVRKAENPVRLKRGVGKYEPRYVYYNGSRTINIITGKSLPLEWTVSKYDPRIMVKLNDKDAL